MESERFETLKTPYFEKVNRSAPWCEYPRPSLKRDSFIPLNGEWDFAISRTDTQTDYDRKILVPFPPESLLSGIECDIPDGSFMHYRRTLSLPDGYQNKRVILHIGAADTVCDVYVNGKHATHHEGGYLPFSADITEYIESENVEIKLTVKDDLSLDYPYGKQTRNRGGMWYTPTSGVWQTVWIEYVPTSYIEKLKITPTCNSVKIKIFGGSNEKKLTMLDSLEVYEFSGDEIVITPKSTIRWTPENPHLYRFKIESGEDIVESYFALREIGTKTVDGIPRLTLNGEPYLFNGLLDQGYFPDGIFLPATPEGYEKDIRTAKELGFNMLRKHIKIEPEIFYYLCDKLGMVVFQDMVNNSTYSFIFDTALPTVGMKRFPDKCLHRSKRSRKIFEEHMYATMDHLHNFPSILYYTIFNEGWGQFCADEMYGKAKAYDSTRIIDSTSGWFTEKKSDVDSRHVYFKKVKITKKPSKPLVISEFGGYSHRVAGHLFGNENYGYKLFEERGEFEAAFYELYEKEISPLIKKGICALVYTQLTDVEDETNGLITYDRRVIKLGKERTYKIMTALIDKLRKQ